MNEKQFYINEIWYHAKWWKVSEEEEDIDFHYNTMVICMNKLKEIDAEAYNELKISLKSNYSSLVIAE